MLDVLNIAYDELLNTFNNTIQLQYNLWV